MGFATTGADGNIYFYDLYGPVKDLQKRNDEYDYVVKDVKMQCLSTIPGSTHNYDVLAVGSDKQIHNNNNKTCKINPENMV